MLVLQDRKALVLTLNNPERVVGAVPGARVVHTANGNSAVVVPHETDTVHILNNLGIETPSPILYHYDWPGEFTPYEHQIETSNFLCKHRKCLVLNEIGTGKTHSALWAADYLMREGIVKKTLIVSPLSTLERVWHDAIFKGFIGRKAVVLHGTAARRRKLLATDVDFYIINHDGFNILSDDMINMFDLVIVDEAAVLRNPSANRYRIFKKWMDKHPAIRLWLMTGTPTPNEPTDAWTLSKLVDSPYTTTTYTAFKNLTMFKFKQYTWLPKVDSAETVFNTLQPSIRFSRDECFDLPPTVFQTRQVDLSTEQRNTYDAMMKRFVASSANGEVITAVNEAVKMQKLVQIACGVAYSEDGDDILLDASPRIKVLKEVIKEAGEKVIVFVPLTGTLHMIEKELSKITTVGVVNGQVSSAKRNKIFHDFQESKDPQVLLAHPQCMAHGLTLTAASTVVWYGPITSNEQYVQANGRIERIGKRHSSNVVHIQATKLEAFMYQRLKNKQKMQGVLLDLVEQQKA